MEEKFYVTIFVDGREEKHEWTWDQLSEQMPQITPLLTPQFRRMSLVMTGRRVDVRRPKTREELQD